MLARPDLDFDAATAVPEVAALRAGLARRDWPAARAALDGAEPSARTYLVGVGAAQPGVRTVLRAVLDGDPDDGAAAAMLGAALTQSSSTAPLRHTGHAGRAWPGPAHVGPGSRSWERRRTQPGDAADRREAQLRDATDRRQARLREAELVLMDGAARNPADCAIWVYRLKTARGLRLGASELRRRYDRLAAQDPHHLPGQSQLLQSLCPKWGGEWPAAHAFARDRMLAAPPGSLNAGLVVEAHLEQWLARDGGRAGQRYLADEPVRAQLYEAARRSVWHDDFRAAPGWVAVAHTFAMAFSLLGDQAATASLFVSLGNLASMHPWRYLGDPGREIRARRARALARGVRR